MKVIYISFSRLTNKLAGDLYIDYLTEQGVTVEYWDIVALVREEHDEPGMRDAPYVHRIKSYGELKERLAEPDNARAVYFVAVSWGAKFIRLYRMLSRRNCRIFFVAEPEAPRLENRSQKRRIATHLRHPLQLAALVYATAKVIAYRRLRLVKPYDVCFTPGEVSTSKPHYAVKQVPVNLKDYDRYLLQRSDMRRLVDEPYIVFINGVLPYHHDITFLGLPRVNAARYCESLNRFFRLLENRCSLPIVVATHPTADDRANCFQGRGFYRGETPRLIAGAELVVAHHSTSISYAVINRKPLMFIYTDDMLALYGDTGVRSMEASAAFLNAGICNVDRIGTSEEIAIPTVSQERYDRYKYDFLTTHETEDTPTGEIFWRELQSMETPTRSTNPAPQSAQR